jgi:hypothetical protein
LRLALDFDVDLGRGFDPALLLRDEADRFIEDFFIAGFLAADFFALDFLSAGPRRADAHDLDALFLRVDFFAPRLAPADRALDFLPALLPPPDFLARVAICRSLRVSHRVEQPGPDITANRRVP